MSHTDQSLHHKLWVEKYRPTTLDQYIFHDDEHKSSFKKMIEEQTIPHLLLSGVQGSGKTTLAKVLINELKIDPTDVLIINASDENSVETMRDKIKNFISTWAMGKFKVVLLDEADYISLNGQAVLRNMMETYSDAARFILTCNYDNKIIPQLKSRTQEFRFKAPDQTAVTEFVAKILLSEHVKFDLGTLDAYVSVGYPDIRKIINMLQQYSINGVLMPVEQLTDSADYKFKLLELIERDQWNDARRLACNNVVREEWEGVYRFLYENLHKAPKFSTQDAYESGIVIIADHLYKHSLVADPEINAAAMFIRLSQI